MNEAVKSFIDNKAADMRETLRTLALIPAPSGMERERARFCADFLRNAGAAEVRRDRVGNLICPLRPGRSGKWIVFSAHMDTVFPLETPLSIKEEGDRWVCPGIGDDTASLVVLLYAVRFILENATEETEHGILLLATMGEEIGSVGAKAFTDDFGAENMAFFYSFDGNFRSIYPNVVNREMYRIHVNTPGGHALGAYGSPNAIEELAKLLQAVCGQCREYVASIHEGRNAFNVNTVSGGTGNNIADHAVAEMQFRSNRPERVETMVSFVKQYVQTHGTDKIRFTVEPYGDEAFWNTVPDGCIAEYGQKHLKLVQSLGVDAHLSLSATDCRYPMHKGVPSLCMGMALAYDPHTLRDSVVPGSLPKGLEILLAIFEMNGLI